MKSEIQHLKKEDVQLINENFGYKIIQNNGNELFYVFDKSFKVPKTYINILLRYKDPFSFTKHVKTIEEVFIKTYENLLNSYQISVELNVSLYGVNIKIGGFSSQILKVTKIFMKFYFDNSDNSREEIVKEQIRDDILSSIYLSPYRRIFQGLYKSLIENYLYPEEKLKIFESDSFVFDIFEFKASIDIVGNISLEDSISILEIVSDYSSNFDSEKNLNLKQNKLIKLQSTDTENNAVGFFYKICSPQDYEISAKGKIVLQLLQERFFNQLRTIEELGYIVTSNSIVVPSNCNNEVYLYFIVQSEREPEFLIDRISKFIEESKEFISTLDDSTFELFQESVIDGLKEKPKNLCDYSEFINQIFTFGVRELNYKDLLIEKVEDVTLEDLKRFDLFEQDPIVVVVNKTSK